MTIYEILKDMGASDERIRRKGWGPFCVATDRDSSRMFFYRFSSESHVYPWHPKIEDLEADDWEYWSMPDAES